MSDDAVIGTALEETREKMAKALEHLKADFSAVRTGRAAPAVVERLRVEYYGGEVPLQQLAGFSVPEPRVLVITPYDRGAMKAIEKAIQNSDLGINPSNDGQVIRLSFPQLTEERRREFVKVVRARGEDARIAVRGARRATRHSLEALEKAGQLSADDLAWAETELEKLTHELIAEVDRLLAHKEQELLEV
jgi:ribosome recycling factor